MVTNIQDIPGLSPVAHQLGVTSAAKPVHVFGDLGYLNLCNKLFAFFFFYWLVNFSFRLFYLCVNLA